MRDPNTIRAAGLTAALAILLVAGAAAPRADELEEPPDYEQAREAVGRGQAIPLAEILEMVAPRLDGEIVGIELEREGSTLIYELKFIEPGGRLVVVYVEAATGRILEGERPGHADSDR